MPSVLALQGYQLHQQVNDFQLPGFPVCWSKSDKRWKIGNYAKREKYFILSICFKFLSFVCICRTINLAFKLTHLFHIEHKFVPIIAMQFVIISIVMDVIFLIYGEDIIGCCNWCYEAEDLWFCRKMDSRLSISFSANSTPGKSILNGKKGKGISIRIT